MRMLGHLEIKGGWSHGAKHIPGMQNALADGISHCPRAGLPGRTRELTNRADWVEQPIGPRRENIFDVVLQTKSVGNRHDYRLWNIMSNERDPVGVTRAGAPPDTPSPPSVPSLFPTSLPV